MTKEAKIKLLQVIYNAGIKGTDREMLDNLKAVIKAIENEACNVSENLKDLKPSILPAFVGDTGRFKKKAGRPKKVK